MTTWTRTDIGSMMAEFPDDEELHKITKREINLKSRDNARTPMQASYHRNGGREKLTNIKTVERRASCWVLNYHTMAT